MKRIVLILCSVYFLSLLFYLLQGGFGAGHGVPFFDLWIGIFSLPWVFLVQIPGVGSVLKKWDVLSYILLPFLINFSLIYLVFRLVVLRNSVKKTKQLR